MSLHLSYHKDNLQLQESSFGPVGGQRGLKIVIVDSSNSAGVCAKTFRAWCPGTPETNSDAT